MIKLTLSEHLRRDLGAEVQAEMPHGHSDRLRYPGSPCEIDPSGWNCISKSFLEPVWHLF